MPFMAEVTSPRRYSDVPYITSRRRTVIYLLTYSRTRRWWCRFIVWAGQVFSRIANKSLAVLRWVTVWPQQTWAENWGPVPLLGQPGLHLTQHGLGRGLPQCHVAS